VLVDSRIQYIFLKATIIKGPFGFWAFIVISYMIWVSFCTPTTSLFNTGTGGT
jgi:hypothetical protein